MKIELMDDIVYVEVGRTQTDYNYGNWKFSLKVPCRSNDISEVAEELKIFIESKLDSWKSEREKRREALEQKMSWHDEVED